MSSELLSSPGSADTPQTKFDAPRRELFLELLAKKGLIKLAAKDVEISVETVRTHSNQDPAFDLAISRAKAQFLDMLREAAMDRAISGVISRQNWDENGALIQEVRTYSDALLIKLLNRHDPKMRDSFNINAKVDASVEVAAAQQVDLEAALRKLTPEERIVARKLLTPPAEVIDVESVAENPSDD